MTSQNSTSEKDAPLIRGVVDSLELPADWLDVPELLYLNVGGNRNETAESWRDVLRKNVHLLKIIIFEEQMMELTLSIAQRPLSGIEYESFQTSGWHGQLLRMIKDQASKELFDLFPEDERPNFDQRIKDYADTFADEIDLSPSHIADCVERMLDKVKAK